MDPSLLQPFPNYVILELTTRCNLRCLYCALSQPEFHGHDLAFDRAGIIAQFVRLGVREVQISGHGESTIVPGWHEVARAVRAAGITASITTNLSLRLDPEEIAALAQMRSITVSCDTSDPELFARLRRPARFERLEENLELVKSSAPPRGAGRPYIAINCTLTDRVVDGLPELVRWAGARELDSVSLVNLLEYPNVDPSFPVRHPADVDPQGTLARIREARTIAAQLGLDFHVMDGLHTRLQEALGQ